MKVTCFGASTLSETAYAVMVLVGQLLARRGVEVVTGAFGGAMEAPVKGAYLEGGITTGYPFLGIPCNNFLTRAGDCRALGNIGLRPELQFGVRLGQLLSSDAFVFAPEGGTGTMAELMAICVFNMRGWEPRKKVAILDPNGLWEVTLKSLSDSGFLPSAAKECIKLFSTAKELVDWVCEK